MTDATRVGERRTLDGRDVPRVALRDSDYVGYAAAGLVSLGATVLLLFIGPVGEILAFLLVCSTVVLADPSGAFGGASAEQKQTVNCASCGARRRRARRVRSCGDPLSTDSGD